KMFQTGAELIFLLNQFLYYRCSSLRREISLVQQVEIAFDVCTDCIHIRTPAPPSDGQGSDRLAGQQPALQRRMARAIHVHERRWVVDERETEFNNIRAASVYKKG